MAEDVHYALGNDSSSNKRKYEDQAPPSGGARRPTGFSAPISSQPRTASGDAPLSYISVPPTVDKIQLAKQHAQKVAARILSNADAMRPKVENGGSGFDSGPTDAGLKPLISNIAPSSIPVSYGYQGTSKNIEIPNNRVGVIIGRSGETIKYLQLQSGAKIQVTRDMDADPNSPIRMVELVGTPDQIAKAEQLIQDVLSGAEAGGSGIVSRRLTSQQSGTEQYVTKIQNNKVGLVIGKGGETIKNMQAMSGARIQVIPLHLPPGDSSTERTLQIDGTTEQIEAAKQLVNEVIEKRNRNPAMAGGYPQQNFQAQAPTSWAPPDQMMQQPGYGYMQSGAYPSPAPQYNMPTQYPGYPQPTQGGYATGWDQTSGAPNQQTAQGGGYDYYSKQPQQQQVPGGSSAPADNTVYGYGQPPASGHPQGQGYHQDGYGGYPAPASQIGYGQPPPYSVQGYVQEQGYKSTPGYGNPTSEGHTPSYGGAQGDTSQAPPSVQSSAMGQHGYLTQQPSPSPASYPSQGSSQSGYGVPTLQPGCGTQPTSGYGPAYGLPQAQKPSANQSPYGQQPQQSPSAQGGYGQPGYPHSQAPMAQAGYTQPDSGGQRTPPSGYGAAAQHGYGGPP